MIRKQIPILKILTYLCPFIGFAEAPPQQSEEEEHSLNRTDDMASMGSNITKNPMDFQKSGPKKEINMKKKIYTPEEILPSGDDYALVVNPFTGMEGNARKGTVAATLNNIAILDSLLLDSEKSEQILEVSEEINKLIPSLKVVGIFDLFKLEEWFSDDQSLGRIYVAGLYLKQYPEEKTPQIAEKIKKIQECTKSIPLKSCLEQTLGQTA